MMVIDRVNKITVMGDGGWGTTIANLLADKGLNVCLWCAFKDYAKVLSEKRENIKFLPGININQSITILSDVKEAVGDAEMIVLAVPSKFFRSVVEKIRGINNPEAIFISVAKGIEDNTLMRMSEIVKDVLGNVKIAVLSGPCIAREVARGVPTTIVAASENRNIAKKIQDVFITDKFRVYTNLDVIGVELGGAVKNVIAIAAGVCDGLGFGANTKAALLTRGIVEMERLGKAIGANERTLNGLAGMGDLITTCFSEHSRNRGVGERIARGETADEILSSMAQIAEGVISVKNIRALGKKYKVDMPITEQVYKIIAENKNPLKAVTELMRREKKEE